MKSISEFLSADHRRGEELFEAAVQAAGRSDWDGCRSRFDAFRAALRRHMEVEEQILFPGFEEATGITAGPPHVMRHEHRQMLGLLEQLATALSARDAAGFSGCANAFVALMAAHSAKEENVLYPMCDQMLPESTVEKLRPPVKNA
ncbi:MAG: hemerythrin domain-containing protein [Betaproteobacteria bacterium]|nr:hemerythrin domain-containing protein [Betaproteobacteria bacterium]